MISTAKHFNVMLDYVRKPTSMLCLWHETHKILMVTVLSF